MTGFREQCACWWAKALLWTDRQGRAGEEWAAGVGLGRWGSWLWRGGKDAHQMGEGSWEVRRRLGMGCLEVEEGGKVLSVDLKAESGPKMEKVGAAVSRNNAEEDRMWTEPSPCPTLINLMGNSCD